MINCKVASELAAKNEERKLSFSQRLKLRFHIMICKVCQLIQKQNNFVITHAKKADSDIVDNITPTHKLSEEEKKTIQDSLKQ